MGRDEFEYRISYNRKVFCSEEGFNLNKYYLYNKKPGELSILECINIGNDIYASVLTDTLAIYNDSNHVDAYGIKNDKLVKVELKTTLLDFNKISINEKGNIYYGIKPLYIHKYVTFKRKQCEESDIAYIILFDNSNLFDYNIIEIFEADPKHLINFAYEKSKNRITVSLKHIIEQSNIPNMNINKIGLFTYLDKIKNIMK